MSVYTSPQPSLEEAARGNFHALRMMLIHVLGRLTRLETKTSIASLNNDSQTPVAQAPKQASVAVASPLAGNVVVKITNPEYVNPAHNPLRTPLLHQVSYSRFENMRQAETLPIGTQTHYALPLSGRYFVQVKSSLDGVNFNEPQKFEVSA